jgi:ATP-binding protein involved in chromosome partitioning
MINKDELKLKLEELIDPSSKKTLKETGGLKHVSIDEDNHVILLIAMESDADEYKRTITRSLAKLIKIDLGFSGMKAEFEALKKGDSILGKKEVKYIGVASGKGGVGKSTVAVNLAYALKRLGKKVGLIDADVYGSSIPTMLEIPIELPKGNNDDKIIPFTKDDIQLISTAFFLPPDKPLMWRGPMLGKMLNHFFYDVLWADDLDYIVVDLPPGTGDIALDIQKLIPNCEMLIVTTPHPSASTVAVKAGFAAKELKHNILGVVENMAYLPIDGTLHKVFGEGGGKIVADKLGTTILQSIPLGQPAFHMSVYDASEEIGLDYLGLANKVMKLY